MRTDRVFYYYTVWSIQSRQQITETFFYLCFQRMLPVWIAPLSRNHFDDAPSTMKNINFGKFRILAGSANCWFFMLVMLASWIVLPTNQKASERSSANHKAAKKVSFWNHVLRIHRLHNITSTIWGYLKSTSSWHNPICFIIMPFLSKPLNLSLALKVMFQSLKLILTQ